MVVARVFLRSAEGERPGIDVPITAGNIGRLAPSPEAVAAVADHFRGAGFAILGTPGITIGISGSKELFERHFGIELAPGADHAYTVRRRARRSAVSAADPHPIRHRSLTTACRRLSGRPISQIALEAAVSIDQHGD